MIGIYLPLAYSLNLILGFGGLISFCHAAFYGIGAYIYCILVMTAGLHPALALAGAVIFTAFIAIAIGIASLRFRGDISFCHIRLPDDRICATFKLDFRYQRALWNTGHSTA
jgi:ABC-type branched-subunit amino acid transport system permease subunit